MDTIMRKVAVRCIWCGAPGEVPEEESRKSYVCPSCEKKSSLPPAPRIIAPLEVSPIRDFDSPEIVCVEVKFICPGCGGKLRAELEKIGQPVICGHCQAAVIVPRPPDEMLRVGPAPQ
jgi:DNA-directed RNA polymerase subunit RPC12/RpoP